VATSKWKGQGTEQERGWERSTRNGRGEEERAGDWLPHPEILNTSVQRSRYRYQIFPCVVHKKLVILSQQIIMHTVQSSRSNTKCPPNSTIFQSSRNQDNTGGPNSWSVWRTSTTCSRKPLTQTRNFRASLALQCLQQNKKYKCGLKTKGEHMFYCYCSKIHNNHHMSLSLKVKVPVQVKEVAKRKKTHSFI